ncbi:MAG: AtpZ/AtpI family protein [Erysipelotrichaceae bacterium]|jgi:hypothetical protein|nr:AtpZ/AtpI family protein [Erysipelotrichaceae bacterium]MBR2809081.1 AtpZ/AtpI family protein [Erysipelotrichaceae bacterium]
MNEILSLGFTVALSLVAFVVIGHGLDVVFHTGNLLTVIMTLIGAVLSAYYFIYTLAKHK